MIQMYCPFTGHLLLVNPKNPMCVECGRVHIMPHTFEPGASLDWYKERNRWAGKDYFSKPYTGQEKNYDLIDVEELKEWAKQ